MFRAALNPSRKGPRACLFARLIRHFLCDTLIANGAAPAPTEGNDMEPLNELAALIRQDEDAVRRVGLRWACALHATGSRCESAEATDLADTALRALLTEGAQALVNLVLAGTAHGGIGQRDLRSLVDAAREAVGVRALQAA